MTFQTFLWPRQKTFIQIILISQILCLINLLSLANLNLKQFLNVNPNTEYEMEDIFEAGLQK